MSLVVSSALFAKRFESLSIDKISSGTFLIRMSMDVDLTEWIQTLTSHICSLYSISVLMASMAKKYVSSAGPSFPSFDLG